MSNYELEQLAEEHKNNYDYDSDSDHDELEGIKDLILEHNRNTNKAKNLNY